MDTTNTWTNTAKTLHWLIAFLLLAVWASVELHELVPRGNPWRDYWIIAHFTLGASALAVMVIRLVWRASHRPPAPWAAACNNGWPRRCMACCIWRCWRCRSPAC